MEWRQPFQPDDSSFTEPGSHFSAAFNVDASSSPYEVLKQILEEVTIKEICEETNLLVRQVRAIKESAFPKWKDVTPGELWRFLGLNLTMGLIKKHSIKAYWSTSKLLCTPFFGNK